MKRAIALVLALAAAGCQHAQPTVHVEAAPGKACPGGDYPADAPCLEKGEPMPFPGLAFELTKAVAHYAVDAGKDARIGSLERSLALEISVGVAVLFLTGFAAFELGRYLPR